MNSHDPKKISDAQVITGFCLYPAAAGKPLHKAGRRGGIGIEENQAYVVWQNNRIALEVNVVPRVAQLPALHGRRFLAERLRNLAHRISLPVKQCGLTAGKLAPTRPDLTH